MFRLLSWAVQSGVPRSATCTYGVCTEDLRMRGDLSLQAMCSGTHPSGLSALVSALEVPAQLRCHEATRKAEDGCDFGMEWKWW